MRARFPARSSLVVAGLLLSSSASPSEPDRADALPGPGRVVPDLVPSTPGLVDTLGDGTRRSIVNGMRIVDYPDGSIERAREILPAVTARPPVALPARLGGGVVFAVWFGDVTQLWRAKSWMGELEPLAVVPGKVGDIVPGFDRIYLTVSGGLRAIDPFTGAPRSIQPLPGGTAVGPIAFADAWRAVAVADYRGPLTTFDAGNTWHRVPLDGNVLQVSVREGSFLLDLPGRRSVLGTSGELLPEDPAPRVAPIAPRVPVARRALGVRPLRAAIESGWPLRGSRGEQTAVFAQAGTLYRVALERVGADHPTGSVLDARPGAFRSDDDSCRAVPLGRSFGFICDSPGAGSVIYAFDPPFAMREVMRFDHHREIASSGNGALVVSGRCEANWQDFSASHGPGVRDDEWTLSAPTAYCFLFASGEEREVTLPALTRPERAGARPVALADGRALFLLQPGEGASPRLLISGEHGFATVPLALGEREAWLSKAMIEGGVEERNPGVLGAWAVAGNDLRGVRIGIDGRVTLASASTSLQRTAVSGRYAFDWGTAGRGKETIDGGMSWSVVDLPASPLDGAARAAAACGPVGASEGATRDGKPGIWLRVGWGGSSEDPDLLPAKPPLAWMSGRLQVHGVALRCEPTGEISGPPPPKPKPVPAKKPLVEKKTTFAKTPIPPSALPTPPFGPQRGLPPIFNPSNMARTPPVASQASSVVTPWTAFRAVAPPTLRSDEKGLEAGTDISQARIYVWGTKGADWSHNGHVMVRFDDRFDLSGVRATAVTPSLWPDEDKAAEALGLISQQPMSWSVVLDVSGQAVVLVGQRPGRTDLYGAAQGEPVTLWRDAGGAQLAAPLPGSVVRIESTWFYLGSAPGLGSNATTIYRVDGGVVRRLARLPRIASQDPSSPRLARRVRSRGLGLLIRGVPAFDQSTRDWYVLNVNEESGELDEPVRLFGSDLDSIPPRCSPDEDGWLVTPELGVPPALSMVSPLAGNLTFVEARLRLDAGKVCVDALASREEGLMSPTSGAHLPPPVFDSAAALSLAATDAASGRRWLLRCGQ